VWIIYSDLHQDTHAHFSYGYSYLYSYSEMNALSILFTIFTFIRNTTWHWSIDEWLHLVWWIDWGLIDGWIDGLLNWRVMLIELFDRRCELMELTEGRWLILEWCTDEPCVIHVSWHINDKCTVIFKTPPVKWGNKAGNTIERRRLKGEGGMRNGRKI
jgi:hypothetical protein